MYYPYFRGKQFELIAIRETAALLATAGFTAIIEPVKESLNGLHRTLNAISEANGTAIVIVNPLHGDHAEDGDGISTMLKKSFQNHSGITAGILLRGNMSPDDAISEYKNHLDHSPTFIHSGFMEAKALANKIGTDLPNTRHVFNETHCGLLYRKHFRGCNRVLLRDGFHRRKNADYPPSEEFSDLHVTYSEEGMNGFGDFLIVGDDYTEGGGPAYAVAIHLTYIDPDKDDVMKVYHFVSATNDTPTDPAGKFNQAVAKLVEIKNQGNSKLLVGNAINEFCELHANGHYPGLGSVKKLSMKHHIETLATYFLAKT